MGDFNHGHIQWKSLESTWGEDQYFLFLIQDSFLTLTSSGPQAMVRDASLTNVDVL